MAAIRELIIIFLQLYEKAASVFEIIEFEFFYYDV